MSSDLQQIVNTVTPDELASQLLQSYFKNDIESMKLILLQLPNFDTFCSLRKSYIGDGPNTHILNEPLLQAAILTTPSILDHLLHHFQFKQFTLPPPSISIIILLSETASEEMVLHCLHNYISDIIITAPTSTLLGQSGQPISPIYTGIEPPIQYSPINNNIPLSHINNKELETIIETIVRRGFIDCLKYIIKTYQISPKEIRYEDHITLLHVAVESGKIDLVEYLIQHEQFDMNHDEFKTSLLFHSASRVQWEIVKYFITNHRANINATQSPQLVSLLHYAASQTMDISIIGYLIDNGINPTIRDARGRLPILIAAASGRFDIVRLLIDKYHVEWDIEVVYKLAQSRKFSPDAMIYFSNKGIDVNTKNGDLTLIEGFFNRYTDGIEYSTLQSFVQYKPNLFQSITIRNAFINSMKSIQDTNICELIFNNGITLSTDEIIAAIESILGYGNKVMIEYFNTKYPDITRTTIMNSTYQPTIQLTMDNHFEQYIYLVTNNLINIHTIYRQLSTFTSYCQGPKPTLNGIQFFINNGINLSDDAYMNIIQQLAEKGSKNTELIPIFDYLVGLGCSPEYARSTVNHPFTIICNSLHLTRYLCLFYIFIHRYKVNLNPGVIISSSLGGFNSSTIGANPIHILLQKDYIEQVKYLLHYAKSTNQIIDMMVQDGLDKTPMYYAISSKSNTRIETIKLLIEYNIDINALIDMKKQIKPIHYYAQCDDINGIEFLLSSECQGVNINSLDINGSNALFIAIQNSSWKAAKLLLQRGIDINHSTTLKGQTFLHIIAKYAPSKPQQGNHNIGGFTFGGLGGFASLGGFGYKSLSSTINITEQGENEYNNKSADIENFLDYVFLNHVDQLDGGLNRLSVMF